jgi:hypothetical protein
VPQGLSALLSGLDPARASRAIRKIDLAAIRAAAA